jgi:hypothetical protein
MFLAGLAILLASPQAGAQSAQAVAHSARGSGEVRAHGTCGGGATAWLRLKADHGKIRIRFRVDSHRGHARWRVVLVREGRIVWRGRVRADGGGSFTVKRRIRNLRGADQVTARALGRRGITCIAQATLRG